MSHRPVIRFIRTCSLGADRLKPLRPRPLAALRPEATGPSVFIDPRVTFQTIEGFGGAFTEAARAAEAKPRMAH